MKRVFIWSVALSLATAGVGFAQQQGGGAGGGGGGGTTNTGGGGTTTPGGGQQGGQQGGGRQQQDPFGQQQQRMPEMQRPVFLSGKVVMDNGEIPPEPVTIVRVCNGQRTPESYSDRKGNFSFQVGGNPSVALTDASVGGLGGGPGGGGFGNNPFGSNVGMGGPTMSGDMSVDFTGCELIAELPGFRSDSVSLGRRRAMDNPDVGVIVLHGLGGRTAQTVVSMTTLQAPKKAKDAFDKAMREMTKKSGDPQKAAKELEKAVAEYPQFAAAWTLLGDTRGRLNDRAGAREAYEKAVESDPEYLRPYPALVQMAMNDKDWTRTAELSEKMLSLNPGMTQVRYYQAVAHFNTGNIDDARSTALAIQQGPDAEQFPQTHQMMGLIYSQQGAFGEAANEYRTYLKAAPDAASAEQIKKQLSEWEVLGVIKPVAQTAAN